MPSLVIEFTADQAIRIQNAFEMRLKKPDPDMNDLKLLVISQIRSVVLNEEKDAEPK